MSYDAIRSTLAFLESMTEKHPELFSVQPELETMKKDRVYRKPIAPVTHAEAERIRALFAEGRTVYEVAELTQRGISTVSKIVNHKYLPLLK